MRVIGINRTQDASITLIEDGQHVFSIQKERLSRLKHHWGKLGDIVLYMRYFPQLRNPADFIVECFSSDDEIVNIEKYHEELRSAGLIGDSTKVIQIPHHLAHLFSVFPYTRFSQFSVMVIDSIGSKITMESEEFPLRDLVIGEFEIASFYLCKGGTYECIKKQTTPHSSRDLKGLGKFYSHLKKSIFPGEGNEGKVMGLAAYGDRRRFQSYPHLAVVDGEVVIPPELYELLNSGKYLFTSSESNFQEKADLAAFGQYLFEMALIQITEWLISETGLKNIAYVGGCALNCVANGVIKRRFPDINLYIPPAPNDAGTAIGCAAFAYWLLSLKLSFHWSTDFLGTEREYDDNLIKDFCIRKDLILIRPENLSGHVAKLIGSGFIVCVFHGRSEFGPRALGNRSILCNPKYEVLKHVVNFGIKGREWFRPIAPVIAEEDVSLYFKSGFKSSFMLFCMEIVDEHKDRFPTIGHPDHHLRVQTVNEVDNEFLYGILRVLRDEYDIPMLANTSFNGPDETMVEVFEDAIETYFKYSIDYFVFPPYIIFKRDLKSPLLIKQTLR